METGPTVILPQHLQTTTQRVQPSRWPAAAPPHPNTRSSINSVTTDDSRHGKRSRQQPDRDGESEPPPPAPQGPAAPQQRGTRRCHRGAPTEITPAPRLSRLSPAVNPLCLASRGSAAPRGCWMPRTSRQHPGGTGSGRRCRAPRPSRGGGSHRRDRGPAPATAGMSPPLPRGFHPPLRGVCPRSGCPRRAPAPSRRGGSAAPGTLHPPPPLSAGSAGRGRAPPPPPAGACLEPSAAPAPAPPRAVRGHGGTRRAAPAPP